MFKQPTLNIYLAIQVLRGIALAFIVIAGIVMLVDFVELSRNYGGLPTVSAGDVVIMTLMKAPGILEETFPFVILFGVMGALFGLNKRSELIVIRAAGLSAWRFLAPVLTLTFVIGLLAAMIFNPLAANLNTRYENFRSQISQANATEGSSTQNRQIWLREGDEDSRTVIMAESYETGEWRLNDVTFYLFDYTSAQTSEFARRIDADTAQLLPNGFWQLEGVLENAPELTAQRVSELSLPTRMTPDTFAEGTGQTKIPSFWRMPKAIDEARASGFSTRKLIIAFNKLLALPLTLMAMAVVAATASMRLVRLGGALRLIVTGGVIGFAVYFTNNMITAFGENGTLPAIFAVWSVPSFVLFSALGYLCLKEDG